MRREKEWKMHNVLAMVYSVVLVISFIQHHHVSYADDADDYDTDIDPETGAEMDKMKKSGGEMDKAMLKILTDAAYTRFSNFTYIFKDELKKKLDFCIENVDTDWNGAFDFKKDTTFLANCIKMTKGQIMNRMCTAAEISFYLKTLVENTEEGKDLLRPNKNCKLSSWVSGCEPGWACSVDNDTKVDIKNRKDIPTRVVDCQPCCEGFFCPHGLTCMFPCPLGAYCPLGKLNKTSGFCDPYHYQLPPGDSNHTCGGADKWADFISVPELFCQEGYYCPTTIQKNPCSRGHYCRAGSITQTDCAQLATCEPKSATQNITVYGLLFFAGITLVLIIIYNWSDKVLHTREEKQAKSREAAAKSARETAQARGKWKSTTSLAGFSRTFTRKKSVKQQENSGVEFGLPPQPPDSSSSSSAQSKGKKKEPSKLTKMMQELEENPESHEGFNVKIGDKNLKKQAVNKKELHTRSQIFRYAYGQIEKEKAFQEQTKNMSFSGVISMTSDMDLKSRPPIEVVFKDLSLTLKGKKKHLLRCVTGTLSPGRISAVMGPSGAGKTTFLSALTGRATGCTMTGSILINGKDDPMRSYKKIIGFVPQDDVVHGNLTVEENIWFSARCRLPADLPPADKVLIIERVIESLGLQPVRDSLVGTVEKRGISGGQRKRVNVGLEMVMEPSLLILDEPTSGLDSSSSVLLLRALRREALEGVNICMVLHQPSYTLFRMFDDLILLAKGGLTAYHGSVKKVEEYFSGIGIDVPDRVNPPDHFIDILEGIAKPSVKSGVNYKDLPLRWMLHNGYPVPTDILDASEMTAASSSAGESTSARISRDNNPLSFKGRSFVGDLLHDIKFEVEQWQHKLSHNFAMSHDLSNRITPGIFHQYRYFLGRVGKQRLREARMISVDFLILLLAGICLGNLAKVSDETLGWQGYLYTVIAVSLLSKIGALRSFGMDKLHYWRESASGMSSLAYFLAKDTIDLSNTIVKPAVYLSMFYFFNNPRSEFHDNYIVLLCLVYCVTGIAYSLSIYFEPGSAQLWSVLLPVILTMFANQSGPTIRKVANFFYSKWALEAFFVANAKRYTGVWLITRCGMINMRGYDLKDWYLSLAYLIIAGILSRILAYMLLVTFQKR